MSAAWQWIVRWQESVSIIAAGLVAAVVIIQSIKFAARRHERRALREGRWDDQGPLVETEPPPYRYRNHGMEERREVVGEWPTPVTDDRRKRSRKRRSME